MSTKKFTPHAQRELNKNPNVVKCTEAKIVFTEEFALKVCDALRNGEDPYQVFTDNGLSIRILGKARVNGVIGLWRSKYGLEGLPRRKTQPKQEKAHVETAQERKDRHLAEAIVICDEYIANPESLGLTPDTDGDTIHFAAIKKVYDSPQQVVVKDLCAHYGYSYSKYYGYLQSLQPADDEFVNILNPHRKK